MNKPKYSHEESVIVVKTNPEGIQRGTILRVKAIYVFEYNPPLQPVYVYRLQSTRDNYQPVYMVELEEKYLTKLTPMAKAIYT